MRRLPGMRKSSNTHESEPEDIAAKRQGFLIKCLGISVLFALLTFWVSEASFRSPRVDAENKEVEWSGWGNIFNGQTRPGQDGGPVYELVESFWDEVGAEEILPASWLQGKGQLGRADVDSLSDRVVLAIWVVGSIIIGYIGGLVWFWVSFRRAKRDLAFGGSIVASKTRSILIFVALGMGFFAVLLEVRTVMRVNMRETNNSLLIAAKNGDVLEVNNQLAANADINVRAWSKENDVNLNWTYGFTALHWAAWTNNKDLTKLLISKQAEINATDRMGTRVMHVAARRGHLDIVDLLASKGADVNAKTIHSGRQVIYDALLALKNRKEIVELLISKGADVNAWQDGGDTVLQEAVKNPENIEIIKVLLAEEADVNHQGLSYASSLKLALRRLKQCQKDLVRAKPVDKEKHQERLDKMKEIVELLREHGGKE